MDEKLQKNVFFKFNQLHDQVQQLQQEIIELKQSHEKSMSIMRCHIMRIKNGDKLSDDHIFNSIPYDDFSPEQAYDYYNQQDKNFILLDVSEINYTPPKELPEAVKIPLEDLAIRYKEIVNKTVPILVMSENGIRSIHACELLNSLGYHDVNNISGGYKFWPAFKHKSSNDSDESDNKLAA